MSDLADLFPGFKSHWIDTEAGRIFARSGGSGPPLLLLHGFPQTHVEWHAIAAQLAEHFHVVLMDLRGYGWSSAPRSEKGELYTKRQMGLDVVSVMEQLGHIRFHLAGHDRGARVGYRLALDHPGRVSSLAVIDIIPTLDMWEAIAAKRVNAEHWKFLSLPAPEPEKVIGADPIAYLENTLAAWTAKKDLSAFDERALDHYRASFNDPSRIHAACEDYRAGASLDLAYDKADQAAGKKIECPVLALWGDKGLPAAGHDPLSIWQTWATNVQGQSVSSGHFVPEENAEATAKALIDFFKGM